ncbi:hypothetical protein ACVD1N_06010 [Vibrio parahaemolyticus]|uniref:hypothetical protein n=1 Tax=Vibrio parahaemolyticus TaxID=670 RepID=UPI000D34F2D9|nr:hypothetical protein [Vibrio parahaemolyticus]
MRFTTLEELDSYIERLKASYLNKHGLDFENPSTERLRAKLIDIRLQLIAAEFEQSIDPTNIDTYLYAIESHRAQRGTDV